MEKPDLKQAIAIQQKLQTVELENYLQCGNFSLVPLTDMEPKIRRSTNFYILDGGEQYHIIVQNEKSFFHYPAEKNLVQEQSQNLLRVVQSSQFASTPPVVFLPPAQLLYQQLIAPAQPKLPSNGTLVFTVDSSLQLLPMDLLHDGRSYLIERYSIANTLGAAVRPPIPLTRRAALVAGVSQIAPSFSSQAAPQKLQPLPSVEREIQDISRSTESKILLNQQFTIAALQQQLQQNYPILHLTTHGRFSSNPDLTVLLAWDKPLTVQQFDQLLRSRVDVNQSIELLVLSACETAKGDRRSALGLAGIATQARARSTIASLWLVGDNSTAQMFAEFYTELKQEKTKAESLRQAKLKLLSQPETSHPYYWAPFILVGSWV